MVHIISLLFACVIQAICAQAMNISIPIDKPLQYYDREIYSEFIQLDINTTLSVTFQRKTMNKNISFVIFQVHSHVYQVTAYNNTLGIDSTAVGTNIGLYSNVLTDDDTFYVINNNDVNIQLYISVHGYTQSDPIPGGCNMEFPIAVSPYLTTEYTEDIIYVSAPQAKENEHGNCNGNSLNVTFYRMYLTDRSYSPDAYFAGIKSMNTLETIFKNGVVIPMTSPYWYMKRALALYPRMGSIYVAVVTSDDKYAVYTPTYTYGCSPLKDDCYDSDVVFEMFWASMVFIGIFLCFFGHKFFKTEMFLFGMFDGILITYISISLIADLDKSAILGASIMSGIFFGGIWWLLWWFYGLPLISVFLPILNLGFLIASIIFSILPGGISILTNDTYFWVVFTMTALIAALILAFCLQSANVAACAALGAGAALPAADRAGGGAARWLLGDVLRRATVRGFNLAVVAPPFQWREVVLVCAWALVSAWGRTAQARAGRARAPFPPAPRELRLQSNDEIRRNPTPPRIVDERTPLL